VTAFWIAIALTVLFVSGSVFAMQPSPRQRQLARMRQAAVAAGLRVRMVPGESLADYALPWRLAELEAARATDFVATREEGSGWALGVRGGPSEAGLRAALASLPASVRRVAGGADGLVVRWPERGGDAEVRAIADCLATLRELCAGIDGAA
jgi:hypothetical protein